MPPRSNSGTGRIAGGCFCNRGEFNATPADGGRSLAVTPVDLLTNWLAILLSMQQRFPMLSNWPEPQFSLPFGLCIRIYNTRFLGPTQLDPSLLPNRYLDWFSRFCTGDQCVQQTETQTNICVRHLCTSCIYAHVQRCMADILV